MRKNSKRDYTSLVAFLLSMVMGVPFALLMLRIVGSASDDGFSGFVRAAAITLLLLILVIAIIYVLSIFVADWLGLGPGDDE